jgi:hypothetical protein
MEAVRPKLKLSLTSADKVLEACSWVGLAGLWLSALLAFSSLPEIVPTHFNLAGKIDGNGSKINVLFLPVIPTILAIGLSILNKYPHTFNYLEEITPANAERNYRTGTRILRLSKLFVILLFGAILFLVINSAGQNVASQQMNVYVKAVIIMALLMPVIILLISFLQSRKQAK